MEQIVSYRIDDEDRLCWVNKDWSAFAAANNGRDLLPDKVLGQVLWRYISDATTVHLYQLMLRKVRLTGRTVAFDLRCDSPDRLRYITLQARKAGTMVQFDCHIIRDEPHLPLALLDPAVPRSADLLCMCGWCMRMRIDDQWLDTADGIRRLKLFESSLLPMISHSICPDCYDAMRRSLNRDQAG